MSIYSVFEGYTLKKRQQYLHKPPIFITKLQSVVMVRTSLENYPSTSNNLRGNANSRITVD
jgi:hypothetical protein